MQTVPLSNPTSAVQNQTVALAALSAHPRNYNHHSPAQVKRIAASLTKFGQVRSVVAWRGKLLAGHGVTEAAKSLGWTELRVEVLPDSYDEQLAQAYIVADNELARQSDLDQVQLAQLLEEARQFDVTLLDAIGYSDKELDALLAEVGGGAGAGADTEPQVDKATELQAKWQTETGQLWRLGPHRLAVGDCTDRAVVERLLGGELIDAMLTDPPYSSGGQFRSDRSRSTADKYVNSDSLGFRRDFSGDNRDQRAFLSWASMWLSEAFARSKGGAIAMVFTDWRQLPIITDAVQCGGWVWRNIVTWWKPGIRMQRGRFSSSAEYAIYASNGVPLEGESSPQNVLSVAPVAAKEHIAEKPVDLLAQMLGVTVPGAIVYEPFAGSGSTLMACHNLDRPCRAVEISPAYCAVILQRWADHTGQQPEMIA